MRKKDIYHYYVEGEDEKKLLDVLKGELGCIESGKVDKVNVVQTKFSIARIRPLVLCQDLVQIKMRGSAS